METVPQIKAQLPAFFTLDAEQKWALEMPNATYQGTDAETLFILLCDIILDTMAEMPKNSHIISQIVQS